MARYRRHRKPRPVGVGCESSRDGGDDHRTAEDSTAATLGPLVRVSAAGTSASGIFTFLVVVYSVMIVAFGVSSG